MRQLGKINKYDGAQKTESTLALRGIVLNYSVVTDMTAYDAVPITYSVSTIEKTLI